MHIPISRQSAPTLRLHSIRNALFWLIALCLLLGTATTASANGFFLWTNTAGGVWQTPANWSPNLPAGVQDVGFSVPGTYSIDLISPVTANSLTSNGGNVTLLNQALDLTTGPLLLTGSAANNAKITLNNSLTAGSLTFGANTTDNGTITLPATGTLTVSGPVNIGVNPGPGTTVNANLAISGGTFSASGLTTFGPHGRLTLSAGTFSTTSLGMVNANSLAWTGGTLEIRSSTTVGIGSNLFGHATVDIATGKTLKIDSPATTFTLGLGGGLNISGGTALFRSFTVGATGNFAFTDGFLTINGGTYSGQAEFGLVATSPTTNTVLTGLIVSNRQVGSAARPILTLQNGATATATFVGGSNIGSWLIGTDGTKGGIIVTGAGSTLAGSNTSGNIVVGAGGIDVDAGTPSDGTLAISNGGLVKTNFDKIAGTPATGGNITIGFSGGKGLVTVDGAGSVMQATAVGQPSASGSSLSIGESRYSAADISEGTLAITNGGQTNIYRDISVGSNGGKGIITIDGLGSTLQNTTGLLQIGLARVDSSAGAFADGSLTISNGGLAKSASHLNLGTSGGKGLITIGGMSGAVNSTLDVAGNLILGQNSTTFADSSATLTINSGALVKVAGTTATFQSANAATINLQGGTFRTGALDRSQGGSLNWTDGTLDLTASSPTLGTGGTIGDSLTTSPTKLLRVSGIGKTLFLTTGASLSAASLTLGGPFTSNDQVGVATNFNQAAGTTTISGLTKANVNTTFTLTGGSFTTQSLNLASASVASFTGGTLTVDGGPMAWRTSADMNVTSTAGTASLFLKNGASGTLASQVNTFTTNSPAAGDYFQNYSSATFYAGLYGSGSLAISNASTLSAPLGWNIGINGAGSATVDGAGSQLNSPGVPTSSRTNGVTQIYVVQASNKIGSGFLSGTNSTPAHGTLLLTNGGKASSNGAFYIGYAGGIGTVAIDGAGSSLSSTGSYLFIGYSRHVSAQANVAGDATLALTNGGQALGYYDIQIGSMGGKGVVTVDGAGSRLSSSTGAIQVGASLFNSGVNSGIGDGALTLSNGAQASSIIAYIGIDGGKGVANLGGAATAFNVSDALNVGVGRYIAGAFDLGGDGQVNITNGAQLVAANTSHTNIYTSNGFPANSTYYASISIGTSLGKGVVAIDGIGSRLLSSGNFYVGLDRSSTGTFGDGSVNITHGGQLVNNVSATNNSGSYISNGVTIPYSNNYFQTTFIGYAGGRGLLSIDGAGSSFSTNGTLNIGYYGFPANTTSFTPSQGTLTLTAGAQASASDVIVGGSGGTGAALIDGPNSKLTATNGVNIGYGAYRVYDSLGNLTTRFASTGQLTISNGGALKAAYINIGGNDNSTASLTLAGAASSLNATSYLYVNGGGTLNLQGGSFVTSLIALEGGNINVSTSITTSAALVLDNRSNTLTLAASSGAATTFTAASFSKTPRATLLVRGSQLGVNVPGTANSTNILFTASPASQLHGGSLNTTNAAILYGLFGDNSPTGFGTGFVTYDPAKGLRLLNSNEYNTSTSGGGNLRLTNTTATSVSSYNSLLLENATLNINGFSSPDPILAASGNNFINGGTLVLGSGFVYTVGNLTINSVVTGAGIFKSGPGTLTLTAPSTYGGGGTYINDGTIKLIGNGTIGSGTLFISATGALDTTAVGHLQLTNGTTLTGNGNVKGDVWVSTNGKISPGNSPGELTGDSQLWGSAGVYDWQLTDATRAAGTGYDTVTLSDSITLAATPADPFIINLLTIDANSDPGLALFDTSQNYSWTLLSAPHGIDTLDLSAIHLDLSQFQNPLAGGSLSLAASDNHLFLNFTSAAPPIPPAELNLIPEPTPDPLPESVPEPATAALLLMAAPLLLKRRTRSH